MKGNKAVLLDTSFFIRFLNDRDPLFAHADGYFQYFLRADITMLISTVSIAEYCVGGSIEELPLRNLQVLPFNVSHSLKAGEFARIGFQNRPHFNIKERNIIPANIKLFAQACVEERIDYYLTSDAESAKVYKLLQQHDVPGFEFLDLHQSHLARFGGENLQLDFGSF